MPLVDYTVHNFNQYRFMDMSDFIAKSDGLVLGYVSGEGYVVYCEQTCTEMSGGHCSIEEVASDHPEFAYLMGC